MCAETKIHLIGFVVYSLLEWILGKSDAGSLLGLFGIVIENIYRRGIKMTTLAQGSSGQLAYGLSIASGVLSGTIGDAAIGVSGSVSINAVVIVNLVQAALDAKGGITQEISDLVLNAVKSYLGAA